MGNTLRGTKEPSKPKETEAKKEVEVKKEKVWNVQKVDREGWEYLYLSKVLDRQCYLVILAFIPVGKHKFKPMLEQLRPGGNKFYKDYIQEDLFTFKSH